MDAEIRTKHLDALLLVGPLLENFCFLCALGLFARFQLPTILVKHMFKLMREGPVAEVVHQCSNLYTELVLIVHVEQGLSLLNAIYNLSSFESNAETMLESTVRSTGKPEAGVPKLFATPQPLELSCSAHIVRRGRCPIIPHAQDDCNQIIEQTSGVSIMRRRAG